MYSLTKSLPFFVSRAGVMMGVAFLKELKEVDLTLSQWRALAGLWSAGQQTVNSLSALTSVDASTMSRQISSLVDRGLVVRAQSGSDWRSVDLNLSDKGRVLVADLIPKVEIHEEAATRAMSEREIEELKRLLTLVYDNLAAFDQAILGTPAPGQRKKRH